MLRECPQLHLAPLPFYEGFSQGRPELAGGEEEIQNCVRLFPHRVGGEGHFLALFQKEGRLPDLLEERGSAKGRISAEEESLLDAFFRDVSWSAEKNRIEVRKGQVYLSPPTELPLGGNEFSQKRTLSGGNQKEPV